MELELERTEWNGFETVLDTTVCREETLESIVPDACPDILRICDVDGNVFLTEKQAQEGRAEFSGTIRAVLLYLPEGGDGIRRMEVSLPFTCGVDAPAITSQCLLTVLPRLQSGDARLLNPRKVLIRVSLALDLQVFCPISQSLCCGVCQGEKSGIEQLTESRDAYITVCVREKPFTFSDDLTLSGGKPEAEELLKCRAYIRPGEAKVIGSKLIFKGETLLQLLCRASDGALFSTEFELPFSQIMEVSGGGEDAGCQVQVILTGLDCSLDGGDGRSFSVALDLLAQAVVREERRVELLTDAYSTLYPLTAEYRTDTLARLLDQGEREVAVRELLETGGMPSEVTDAYACVEALVQEREGERLTLAAQVNVTVVYAAADGEMASVTRPLRVVCGLELPEQARCTCLCRCTAPVFAVAAAGGVEVRFPMQFLYTALAPCAVAGISGLCLDDSAPLDHTHRPSVVLRMVAPGERLWDIAKSYGTTAQGILQANELDEETIPDGTLLLIPRKR